MEIIKTLAEKIEEELNDADAYIEMALQWKSAKPETAALFCELSEEEMSHVDKLHAEVTRLISEYKQKTGEPPKDMMTLYNYLHEKHMARAMTIKVKQGMFNS